MRGIQRTQSADAHGQKPPRAASGPSVATVAREEVPEAAPTYPGREAGLTWVRSAIITVLLGAAGSGIVAAFAWRFWVGATIIALLAGLLAAVVLLPTWKSLIILRLAERYQSELRAMIAPDATNVVTTDLNRLTGLVEIYPTFADVQSELLEALGSSRRIDLFLLIGTTVSLPPDFYDALRRARLRPKTTIRLLKASVDNRYLSPAAAVAMGKQYAAWAAAIAAGDQRLRALEQAPSNSDNAFQTRTHKEGYLWRYFILDDVAYAQPYLFRSDNAPRAPVYKFARQSPGGNEANPLSLYKIFLDHFTQKWNENEPPEVALSDELASASEVVVAAVLSVADEPEDAGGTPRRFVFVVPRRYLEAATTSVQPEYEFLCPGGKVHSGETLVGALQRELDEELGIIPGQYVVTSSPHTIFLSDAGANTATVLTTEEVRPYCVVRRGTQLVVGYEVRLARDTTLHPQNETGLALVMTEDFVRRARFGAVTVESLQRTKFGRVAHEDSERFNPAGVLVPKGVAAVVSGWDP